MKKLILFSILFCAALPLLAQKVFFIFIQSDAGTPFYIKMGDKVLSSTASGYLIIPKLVDSTYGFQLGPSPSEGELRFEVRLQQKDRGFLLKKFAEGWGLFDLQTMAVQRPVNQSTGFSAGEKVNDNRFTSLLAQAADDTSLFYQPVIASTPANAADKKAAAAPEKAPEPIVAVATETPPAQDTVAVMVPPAEDSDTQTAAVQETGPPPTNAETALAAQTIEAADEPSVDTPAADAIYKRSTVMRRAESSTVDGFGLVFWDDIEGTVDTIRIFIPNQKVLFEQAATPAAATEVPVVQKAAAASSACNGKAGEKDFFRMRKNLASIDSETMMVEEAKSNFRKKCFSTEQIRNLSALFLTQQGKWLFLEAAYPFAYDKENFTALQSELREEPYLGRFKLLTGQ